MVLNMKKHGLRRIGFAVACGQFHEENGRYPANPEELKQVTNSTLRPDRFKIYMDWLLSIQAGSEK